MLKIMGLASQTASDFRVSAKEGATWIGLPSLSSEILGDRLVVKTEQMQSWTEGPLGVVRRPSSRRIGVTVPDRSSDEGNRQGGPIAHSRALRSSSGSTTCGDRVDHGMISKKVGTDEVRK